MKKLILTLACLFLTIACQAETIIVAKDGSGNFNNIQDAINYSWQGDTIIVRPGTYYENVNFNSRAITLTSENPNYPGLTQITWSVTFDFGEQSDSVNL